jgi:hypothetical protein
MDPTPAPTTETVTHFHIIETFRPKQKPRLLVEKRPLKKWQIAVLKHFEAAPDEAARKLMLNAAAHARADFVVAMAEKLGCLPQDTIDGLRIGIHAEVEKDVAAVFSDQPPV